MIDSRGWSTQPLAELNYIRGPPPQTPAPPALCPQTDPGTRGGTECEDEPLRALERKHPKPAGLALESVEGQGEAEEGRKSEAWTEKKEDIKKARSLTAGPEETEIHRLCEGSTHRWETSGKKSRDSLHRTERQLKHLKFTDRNTVIFRLSQRWWETAPSHLF